MKLFCALLVISFGTAHGFFSLLDDEACVIVGETPITRVMDASIPVRFDSPGFNFSDPDGSAYPENVHCQWQITLDNPDQDRLMLSFRNFSLEYATDCRFDSVVVQDVDENGPVLLTWCSGVVPDPITTLNRGLFVTFTSNDNGIGGSGFLARAGFPFENTACSGTPQVFNNSFGGVFLSEEYPTPYGPNSNCQYHFIAPPGQRVEVSFQGFDTEDCCGCDTVEVYDGGNAFANQVATFFGSDTRPARIRSASEELFLGFSSDITVNGEGFFGTYAMVNP